MNSIQGTAMTVDHISRRFSLCTASMSMSVRWSRTRPQNPNGRVFFVELAQGIFVGRGGHQGNHNTADEGDQGR